jgi:hypothetical protein
VKESDMKNLSLAAKFYIISIILIGLALIGWMIVELDWGYTGLYALVALGAVAQSLKLEGPNNRTNYSIAWFVYGFTFIAFGPMAAIFVIVFSHLVEWIWYRYPWYIQGFNIGNHVISVYLAGSIFARVSQGAQIHDLSSTVGLLIANLVFVLGNHFLVGVVIKLARGQSFAESGVFSFLTLFLDFTVLSMGEVTALVSFSHPLASVLNILPLYLLYQALRVPALLRQLQEMKKISIPTGVQNSGV